MFTVIFGVSVVAFVLQIAGTSVVNCPKVNNMENLNMEKMLGLWYVARDDNLPASIPCHLAIFHKLESNKYVIEICMTRWDLECTTFENLPISGDGISSTGKVSNDTNNNNALYVRETDYVNNAVVHLQACPKNVIMILSRNKVYDIAQLDKLSTKYFANGTRYFTHTSGRCPKNKTTTD